jgi:hypothetical protein
MLLYVYTMAKCNFIIVVIEVGSPSSSCICLVIRSLAISYRSGF